MWEPLFLLHFPKDSKSLTILDIQLWKLGAKKLLYGTSKSEQTNLQTHGPTNGLLIESIGPEGQWFEKQQQQRSFKLVTYGVKLFRNLCFLATFMTVINVWKMLFNTICVDSPWEIFFYHFFWNRVTLKLYLANWRQNHNVSFFEKGCRSNIGTPLHWHR